MKSAKNNKVKTGSIDWRMLISHHPPSQYARTFRLFKVRFCTRCCAILSGIGVMIACASLYCQELNLFFIFSLILPLPAALNFTLNELGKICNNNIKRAITGFLMGLSIGIAINYLIAGKFLSAAIIISWIFLLEIAVALVLHKQNVLDDFFNQYKNGIYKDLK